MAHELWRVRGNTMTNITPVIGSISWKSNLDELGDEISFSIAYNDDRYHPQNVCNLGDLLILKNGDYEITRAIIVEENKSGRDPIGYIAYDYAFYLNKSTAIYQFNDISADQAIKKICSDFNIPIGNMDSIPAKVNKIFNGKKVSDIIKEILSDSEVVTQKKYLMEMRQGKLFIENKNNIKIKGLFNLAENLTGYDVIHAISNPSKKRSITDMRNTIQIVLDDQILATEINQELINQYGRLQEVISINEDEKVNAHAMAKEKLNELGKVFEETSVDLPGDDRFRAGRLLDLYEPVTGITGTYLIKDVHHSISKGIHTMSLGLEAV
jgi:hypothetical protein